MFERGVIRNKEFASQIMSFHNMRYGNITPTDIDGFIEYKNKCFIFFESKHTGSALKGGQRLALERLTDACHASRPTILFVCHHNESMADERGVDVSGSIVFEYRYNGKWKTGKEKTLKSWTSEFIDWLNAR